MKNISILTISGLLLSMSAFALQSGPECANIAQDAAVKKNRKQYGAETDGCGVKLLHKGDLLATYLVCVTDETEPSEWIVTIEEGDKKPAGQCKVTSIQKAVDSETPDFN